MKPPIKNIITSLEHKSNFVQSGIQISFEMAEKKGVQTDRQTNIHFRIYNSGDMWYRGHIRYMSHIGHRGNAAHHIWHIGYAGYHATYYVGHVRRSWYLRDHTWSTWYK